MKTLIVEDSKVVRTVSRSIMNDLGIKSDEAENGLIALGKISQEKYDFILLDWNMPVMDGMEFLIKAREQNLLDETKVIFCTTEAEIDKITKAIEAGASEYIMKPFTKDIVEDKLKYLGLLD